MSGDWVLGGDFHNFENEIRRTCDVLITRRTSGDELYLGLVSTPLNGTLGLKFSFPSLSEPWRSINFPHPCHTVVVNRDAVDSVVFRGWKTLFIHVYIHLYACAVLYTILDSREWEKGRILT